MAPGDLVDAGWRPTRLVVASGNAHKVVEIERMLRAAGLEVRGLHDLREGYGPAPVIDETADDFAGNARLKAEGIAAWLRERGEPGDTTVLADDSGVCVDALQGRPGVYSARFAGPQASDEDNNRRLVDELRARGLGASAGHYRCVLALARVDGQPWPEADVAGGLAVGGSSRLFGGRWDVELRVQRRGTGGFGYDPHAWLPGASAQSSAPAEDRTVAELSADDKAALSHRGQAMRALLAWLTAV